MITLYQHTVVPFDPKTKPAGVHVLPGQYVPKDCLPDSPLTEQQVLGVNPIYYAFRDTGPVTEAENYLDALLANAAPVPGVCS